MARISFMLVELHLKHLAIFEDARLAFGEGFNVITGEPGSGKSLVARAVGLLLGAKADPDWIRTGFDDAEVEALFCVEESASRTASLDLGELAADGELVLRRALRRTGRGSASVGGSLAATAQLSAVADKLVSVVGQHEHQRLLAPEWHLLLLDQSAGLKAERLELRACVMRLKAVRGELAAIRQQGNERRARLGYLQHQIEEIERIAPKPGEDLELAREREILRHAGELADVAQRGGEQLYESDGAALSVVERVRAELLRAARLDPSLEEVAKLLEPAEIALQEVGRSLISYAGRLEHDPDRLEQIETRLGALERLARVHGPGVDTVLQRLAELKAERDRLDDDPARELSLDGEALGLAADARRRAGAMSERRRAHAGELARAIEAELGSLGMEACRFHVEVTSAASEGERDPTANGWDEVRFLLAPNKGEDLRPLDRIASGGELSRVFLAMSRHLDPSEERPILLFDEVDAGIGGAVAEVVGHKLREISRYAQVLCITHLPQIACLADRHVKLWKEQVGERTVARAAELGDDARVREIARMLGGAEVTAKTLDHAVEMIANAARPPHRAGGRGSSPGVRGKAASRGAANRTGMRSSS